MELHPCFHGFFGIPQETRLLFSYFLNLPRVQTTGFINTDVPYSPLLSILSEFFSFKNSHQQINHMSRFIIAAENPHFSPLDLTKIGIRVLSNAAKSLLGSSLTIEEFKSLGFEDFLWERFFAKTLATTEFEKITSASYQSLRFSRRTLRIMNYGHIFPKIDTKNYDVFVVQTPFPGRVAKNTQLVVRYHDAVPMFVPHLIVNPKSHQSSHYKELCSNAKTGVFACTSHAVRDDLLQLFPSLEKRSPVIYDTISPNYFEESVDAYQLAEMIRNYSYESMRRLSLPEDKDDEYYAKHLKHDSLNYILMVSTLEPRKNQVRLIHAWEALCLKLRQDIKLILVGEMGWQVDPIIAAMRPWQHRGQLFHLQRVPVEHMRLLYRGALCVVCPSVKEGFDLSGVEAMASGGKVVASDISVHREVFGKAAVYFDPYSHLKQAEAIESVITTENNLAGLLHEKGLIQATKYQQNAIQPQWEHLFDNLQKCKLYTKEELQIEGC